MPKNKKLALNSEMKTNQILTSDDEVCISRLSSILLDVLIDVCTLKNICNDVLPKMEPNLLILQKLFTLFLQTICPVGFTFSFG